MVPNGLKSELFHPQKGDGGPKMPVSQWALTSAPPSERAFTLARSWPYPGSMLISWAVLIIAIAGLLVWVLASNAKVAEIGRLAFFCGLFVTCMLLGGKTVRVF